MGQLDPGNSIRIVLAVAVRDVAEPLMKIDDLYVLYSLVRVIDDHRLVEQVRGGEHHMTAHQSTELRVTRLRQEPLSLLIVGQP